MYFTRHLKSQITELCSRSWWWSLPAWPPASPPPSRQPAIFNLDKWESNFEFGQVGEQFWILTSGRGNLKISFEEKSGQAIINIGFEEKWHFKALGGVFWIRKSLLKRPKSDGHTAKSNLWLWSPLSAIPLSLPQWGSPTLPPPLPRPSSAPPLLLAGLLKFGLWDK